MDLTVCPGGASIARQLLSYHSFSMTTFILSPVFHDNLCLITCFPWQSLSYHLFSMTIFVLSLVFSMAIFILSNFSIATFILSLVFHGNLYLITCFHSVQQPLWKHIYLMVAILWIICFKDTINNSLFLLFSSCHYFSVVSPTFLDREMRSIFLF